MHSKERQFPLAVVIVIVIKMIVVIFVANTVSRSACQETAIGFYEGGSLANGHITLLGQQNGI